MKDFDEKVTTVIFTLRTPNHFYVNEKDTSSNLLKLQTETEDHITNAYTSLSEHSTQSSTINKSSIYPSRLALCQEHQNQTKLTGNVHSESMDNIG